MSFLSHFTLHLRLTEGSSSALWNGKYCKLILSSRQSHSPWQTRPPLSCSFLFRKHQNKNSNPQTRSRQSLPWNFICSSSRTVTGEAPALSLEMKRTTNVYFSTGWPHERYKNHKLTFKSFWKRCREMQFYLISICMLVNNCDSIFSRRIYLNVSPLTRRDLCWFFWTSGWQLGLQWVSIRALYSSR